MARTTIKASQVVEDTLEDKDGNTKVSVETSDNEDKIRFTTAGTERMIITNDGKVGIGTSAPGYALDIDGDVRIRGNDIRDASGNKALTFDGAGYVKFPLGVKFATGVLVTSSSSPAGSPDGGWVKFATFDCPGTSNLDTAAGSFLVTLAGQESSNNRQLTGVFMVHAKFTVATDGNGDGVSGRYYDNSGTFINCEPLNADFLGGVGEEDFDPSSDLLMIFTNTDSTPVVDLYIKACAKGKRCFVTHLGGTGQVETFDTDIGWNINVGQSWIASEPAAPSGSVKIEGTYVSKIFSKATIEETLTVKDTLEIKAMKVNVRDVNSTSDIQATDYILRCIQNSSITLTLPAKSGNAGRVLVFKDVLGNSGGPSNNTITIDGDSNDTIDGSANYVISSNREAITLTCDGINGWMITSRVKP